MIGVSHARWLRSWVATAAGCAPADIDPGAALFGEGPLDSTDFVELLLAIEERTNRPVDVDRISPEAFRSIDAILLTFFRENDRADRAA